jgi:DNA-binding LytR/AlgR family response regulator
MKAIIIEDEIPAVKRLASLLQNSCPDIEIVKKLDSVESSVKYLQSADPPDLIFMDIQLADGLSFSIFRQIQLNTPVIFTTAFDHYTLQAFKVNSLDYLLKPIDEKELNQAVGKYRLLYPQTDKGLSGRIEKLMQEMEGAKYKERLLVKRGRQLHYLKTGSVAYYYADGKLCYAIEFNGNSHLLDNNLNQLETLLDPRQFYRVSRHLLVNIESIKKIHTWLGGRLKLELTPAAHTDTVVSRERVNEFKDWLGK